MAKVPDLQTWDPQTIEVPFASLMLASRKSGKSTLIRSLWDSTLSQHFQVVITMCPTDFDEDYAETFPGILNYQEFRPDALERAMQIQQQRRETGQPRLQILVVLDDCSDDGEKHSKLLQKLYTRGRHYDISVIFSTQATSLTGPVWRNNSDLVFIGRQMSAVDRDTVIDLFLKGMVGDDMLPVSGSKRLGEKRVLRQIATKYTKDHGFLVVDYVHGTGDLEDTLFKYKAPPLTRLA